MSLRYVRRWVTLCALFFSAAAVAIRASAPAVAADAFVTASSVHSDSYPPEHAIDGDPRTREAPPARSC